MLPGMERLLIIYCGLVAWLIGVATAIYSLTNEAYGLGGLFWFGVLVACGGGALATLGRQMPRTG